MEAARDRRPEVDTIWPSFAWIGASSRSPAL
jgi:hypothetical protein